MSGSETTDVSLEKLRARDQEEFTRLVDAYSASIFRLGMRMLGNQQDAQDVLQNTFLNAFRHIPQFEGRSSLSTWLYRIAANEALMMLRKKHPETTLTDMQPEDNEDLDEPEQFVDWCCLPEGEMLSKETRKHLDQAIERLPASLRVVFLLRDIEGLSIQETSQALNLTETAVKTRLLRARLHLREQLSRYFGERVKTRSMT
jgi:RNA polymerase sigma-70 factor, ECF subfamily